MRGGVGANAFQRAEKLSPTLTIVSTVSDTPLLRLLLAPSSLPVFEVVRGFNLPP